MKTNTFFRSSLATLLMIAATATASAYDFEVDGIYYSKNSDGKSVYVTYKGDRYDSFSNEYSGSVTIPEKVTYSGTTYSVTSIGGYAFWECRGLTSVTIPNSVTSIGNGAFTYCSGLTSVTIPNSVTSIGGSAFSSCSGLTSVTIPNSVTSIGGSAFSSCSGLTSVTIPNSVTSIGNGAFKYCSGLTSVTIPNSVTSIGGSAFSSCSGLTSVTIPNSVTSIGNNAFYDCSGLTSVTIPNSVTSIGDYAFSWCSSLTSIVVEADNSVYDSRNNCNSVIETNTNTLIAGCKNTIIPNSVTSIGESAFYGCSGLTSVTIPNSVTSIGDYAFDGCSDLKYVFHNAKSCTFSTSCFYGSKFDTLVIGESVEKISGLESYLAKIISQAKTPPTIDTNTFAKVYSKPLYVPKGSYPKYWMDEIWSNFTNIKEITNPVTGIELSKSTMNIVLNGTVQLKATILPGDATLKELQWSSDNSAIASVDEEGNVTGNSVGITTITASAIDGSGTVATCEVTVNNYYVESLSLNPTEMSLDIYQSKTINIISNPEDVSREYFEWYCSNTNVAAIKKNTDGSLQVLGVTDGTAVIACRTTDGSNLKATCKVTVGIGGVEGVEADGIEVIALDGMITVTGVAPEARIEVYNAAGLCIYSGTNHEVPLAQHGIYIVKAQGKAIKVAL